MHWVHFSHMMYIVHAEIRIVIYLSFASTKLEKFISVKICVVCVVFLRVVKCRFVVTPVWKKGMYCFHPFP